MSSATAKAIKMMLATCGSACHAAPSLTGNDLRRVLLINAENLATYPRTEGISLYNRSIAYSSPGSMRRAARQWRWPG
eukprot:scaffold5668_cov111-Isochrysis_galbana.AAC.10